MNEQVPLMYEQVFAWAGLVVLLVLCLPFAGIQRLVLELSTWALRLALLALLGTAAYLWFRPEDLPLEVTNTLDHFQRLRAFLPEPGTRIFGIVAVAPVVVALLPLLAVLDVSRKLAGWRLRRLRILAASRPQELLPAAPAPQRGSSPAPHRIDRRAAADIMAQAGSGRASRAADRREQ